MRKVILTVALGCTLFLSACKNTGQRLAEGWIIHNQTSKAVLALEDTGVISADERADFNVYRQPVYDGLNSATNAYLDDDPSNDGSVDRTLQFIDPLLAEMVKQASKGND